MQHVFFIDEVILIDTIEGIEEKLRLWKDTLASTKTQDNQNKNKIYEIQF